MKPYAKVFKSGAAVLMEKLPVSGMYEVKLRSSGGGLINKVRCDDYRMAVEYRRSFSAIARNRCQ